jgi:hypothetical protein
MICLGYPKERIINSLVFSNRSEAQHFAKTYMNHSRVITDLLTIYPSSIFESDISDDKSTYSIIADGHTIITCYVIEYSKDFIVKSDLLSKLF